MFCFRGLGGGVSELSGGLDEVQSELLEVGELGGWAREVEGRLSRRCTRRIMLDVLTAAAEEGARRRKEVEGKVEAEEEARPPEEVVVVVEGSRPEEEGEASMLTSAKRKRKTSLH